MPFAPYWKIDIGGKAVTIDPLSEALFNLLRVFAALERIPGAKNVSSSKILIDAARYLANRNGDYDEAAAIVQAVIEKLFDPNGKGRRPQLRIVRNGSPQDSG
jgi:hypothetical protein